MYDWAKQEVAIACGKENPEWDGKNFDYGCSCYQSALKAFKSLTEDGHSNHSIYFTKNILDRLIDGKCLTPIEDTEDIWIFVSENEGYKMYQCTRMSSLFKDVYEDGTVKYHDTERACHIDQNGLSWHGHMSASLIDKMFPIQMPYYPKEGRYEVYVEEFLFDPKNGDYDTWGILHIITPEGEKIPWGHYFCEKDGEDVEIMKEEYDKRKANRADSDIYK